MPKWEVRLESPDMKRDDGKPHFRVLRFAAADEDAAREFAERKEMEHCVYRLPADEAHRLEERGPEHPGEKGRLHSHYQSKPYRIVAVREIPTPRED